MGLLAPGRFVVEDGDGGRWVVCVPTETDKDEIMKEIYDSNKFMSTIPSLPSWCTVHPSSCAILLP